MLRDSTEGDQRNRTLCDYTAQNYADIKNIKFVETSSINSVIDLAACMFKFHAMSLYTSMEMQYISNILSLLVLSHVHRTLAGTACLPLFPSSLKTHLYAWDTFGKIGKREKKRNASRRYIVHMLGPTACGTTRY